MLIDDVDVPGERASRGALSIPFLRRHGFAVVARDYQVVMQRGVSV